MSKSKRKDYRILKFKRGVELQIKELGKGLWGDISYGIDRYTCLSSWRQCPAWFTFVSPVLSALLHILHLFHLSWPEYVWRIVVSCFTEYPSICTCLWYFSTLDLDNAFFFFFGNCATEMMCPSQCLISGMWCQCLMAVAGNLVYTWLKQLLTGFPSIKLLFFPSQLINTFR